VVCSRSGKLTRCTFIDRYGSDASVEDPLLGHNDKFEVNYSAHTFALLYTTSAESEDPPLTKTPMEPS